MVVVGGGEKIEKVFWKNSEIKCIREYCLKRLIEIIKISEMKLHMKDC